MSINDKSLDTVQRLVSEITTTENEFQTGLDDITIELDAISEALFSGGDPADYAGAEAINLDAIRGLDSNANDLNLLNGASSAGLMVADVRALRGVGSTSQTIQDQIDELLKANQFLPGHGIGLVTDNAIPGDPTLTINLHLDTGQPESGGLRTADTGLSHYTPAFTQTPPFSHVGTSSIVPSTGEFPYAGGIVVDDLGHATSSVINRITFNTSDFVLDNGTSPSISLNRNDSSGTRAQISAETTRSVQGVTYNTTTGVIAHGDTSPTPVGTVTTDITNGTSGLNDNGEAEIISGATFDNLGHATEFTKKNITSSRGNIITSLGTDIDIETKIAKAVDVSTASADVIRDAQGGIAFDDVVFTVENGIASALRFDGTQDGLVDSTDATTGEYLNGDGGWSVPLNDTYQLDAADNSVSGVRVGARLNLNGNNATAVDDFVDLNEGSDINIIRESNNDITIEHMDVNTTADNTTVTPTALANTGTFDAITGLTISQKGHVTGVEVTTYTLDVDNADTLDGIQGNLFARRDTENTFTMNNTFRQDLVIDGNLTVHGDTVTLNTETLTLHDNFVLLNSDATGNPTQNAGIEVERGSLTNAAFRWNESSNQWEISNDAGSYFRVADTNDITDINTALDGKVDNNQVQTNVPQNAVFTDTIPNNATITIAGDVTANSTFSVDQSNNETINLTLNSSVISSIQSGTTAANVGLGNVDNLSAASIRAGTTAANVGLSNVDNLSAASIQAGTTAANVGLGNVDNLSATSIRGGITSANVTGALGFTPYDSANLSGYQTAAQVNTAVSGAPYLRNNQDDTMSGTLTATDFCVASDERLKTNVETISHGLDKVNAMRGVEYDIDGTHRVGVIAQEMEEIVPEVVYTDVHGMKSVAYSNLVGVLIESVKELTARVEELENGGK